MSFATVSDTRIALENIFLLITRSCEKVSQLLKILQKDVETECEFLLLTLQSLQSLSNDPIKIDQANYQQPSRKFKKRFKKIVSQSEIDKSFLTHPPSVETLTQISYIVSKFTERNSIRIG